jgi:hypothetical protein
MVRAGGGRARAGELSGGGSVWRVDEDEATEEATERRRSSPDDDASARARQTPSTSADLITSAHYKIMSEPITTVMVELPAALK